MESEPFDRDMLEPWRLDNERELKNVSTLPSREEIDALKREIRAENEARQGLKGVRPASRLSRSEGAMGFVVKATTRAGQVLWISRPGLLEGIRSLVPLEQADVFETQTDARIAISKTPRVFDATTYIFEVEIVD
jgi:hypothetical protein